jgi:hypothetical protein
MSYQNLKMSKQRNSPKLSAKRQICRTRPCSKNISDMTQAEMYELLEGYDRPDMPPRSAPGPPKEIVVDQIAVSNSCLQSYPCQHSIFVRDKATKKWYPSFSNGQALWNKYKDIMTPSQTKHFEKYNNNK